ncbi:MAG: hypothetical protein JWQ96_1326 [Segetibacter sp.]|nr:hypothetical protein [Segetibacter sp.]
MIDSNIHRQVAGKCGEKKMKVFFYSLLIASLMGCGITGPLSNTPSQDKDVYQMINKINRDAKSANTPAEVIAAYEKAVATHLSNVDQYKAGGTGKDWERVMEEYTDLNKLADAVAGTPGISSRTLQGFDVELRLAKDNAVEQLYNEANQYLGENNREASVRALELLQRVNQLKPGYKDANRLVEQAYNTSILNVVINTVNYYAQSFGYWGLNNDYVQQEIARDMRFQLGNDKGIRVYTEQEARSNRIFPNRLVDIAWEELFIPMPQTYTTTRQVSKQIQTGTTEDKKPIYQTVTATVYITQKSVVSRGNLTCSITDPSNNRTILYENFPVNNSWREEYATYRGDSRALGTYELALVNNGSRFRDPSRYDMFNNVFRQVYPQLMNRIRSVMW